MPQNYENIHEAKAAIESKWQGCPEVGIILGTGLGKLVDEIVIEAEIPYDHIPHFPVSTVESHKGRLICGTLNGKKVMAMQGRFHFYEGYSMQQVVFPVRVMKFMGIRKLIVSNACGGINPLYPAGSLMAISDHINLLNDNPLIGPNDERIGPRFPDMSQPYSNRLLDLIAEVALEEKIPLVKGIYAAMSGPCLETRAEYRMLKYLGADVIGMSTVPEVIAAVHCGMEVLGISVITDPCLPDCLHPTALADIIAVAGKAEPGLIRLIKGVMAKI